MKESCETEQKPKTLKEFVRTPYFWRPAVGVILGGIGGFLYYYFVGCSSGSCAITSNPISSVIFGSAIGYFILNSPCKTC